MAYAFDGFVLDPDRRELTLDGAPVALEPQAFDVLVHLVRNREKVVSKEELMDAVWGARFVSESAVTSRIKQVRRAVGDDGAGQFVVRTYHGRGYRFVADVSEGASAGSPGPGPGTHAHPSVEQDEPPVLVSRSGGREVRFRLLGQGPPDLLLVSHAADFDDDWRDPRRALLLRELGAVARVITTELPVDASVPDLLQVLDGAACERAILVAEGVPARAALSLVEAHPERFSAVVLFGVSTAHADGADGAAVEEWAPAVTAGIPVLVLHRSGDQVVEVGQGRRLAALLPSAELRVLPGDAHEMAGDVEQVVAALDELVHQAAADEAGRRSLTSLVGLAGDAVDDLSAVLVELGGRRRLGPEGAVIVSFDGPANAFRALGSRRARGLVDEAGVGVAIDDVSRDSVLISGHGVDVARLFASLAGPGEVLFPNVVKHLLAGSGLSSEPMPPVELPHVGHHPVHRWSRG